MAAPNLISGLLQLLASQNAPGTNLNVRGNWWEGGGGGGDVPDPDPGTGPGGDPLDDPTVLPDDDIVTGEEEDIEDIYQVIIDEEFPGPHPPDPEPDIPDQPVEYRYEYEGWDEENQYQTALDHNDSMYLALLAEIVESGDAQYNSSMEWALNEDGSAKRNEDGQMYRERVTRYDSIRGVSYTDEEGNYYMNYELSDSVQTTLRDFKKAQYMHNWESGLASSGYWSFEGGHTADMSQIDWSAWDAGEYQGSSGYSGSGGMDMDMDAFFRSQDSGVSNMMHDTGSWAWTDYYNFVEHDEFTNYSGSAGSQGYWNDADTSWSTELRYEDGSLAEMDSATRYWEDGTEMTVDRWTLDETWEYTPFQFEYNGTIIG